MRWEPQARCRKLRGVDAEYALQIGGKFTVKYLPFTGVEATRGEHGVYRTMARTRAPPPVAAADGERECRREDSGEQLRFS